MPDEERSDDTKARAKRPNYHHYLDIRSDGKGVGPGSINSWLEDWRIPPEILVRRIDQVDWTRLHEIKRFFNFLEKIAKLPPRKYEKDHWEDDPVTEKQLEKLRFFDLPFPQTNLTKGEASRLISFYLQVDLERETQYQDQPAEEEKRIKLLELIKKIAQRGAYGLSRRGESYKGGSN